MMSLALLQEAAVMDPITIQAFAAVLLPAAVQLLKVVIPSLEGRNLLYANLALNALLAAGLAFGAGAPAVQTIALGMGAGLAGSKMVDLKKRGAAPK